MSANTAELACVYASLILHDDGVAITEDKLKTLIDAAGVEVDPVWMTVFARALHGKDLKDLLFNFSSGAAAAPVAAAPAAAQAKEAAPTGGDKKKPEPKKEESDEEMGMGLFD